MRNTQARIRVAAALMMAPSDKHWGYETAKVASVKSGTLYPILRAMLEDGWLEDGWEDPAEAPGRPPRRYYTLTQKGQLELGALAARAPADMGVVRPNLGLAT